MEFDFVDQMILPLLGGALIGTAVTVMLLLNGRVTGISGIVNGLLTVQKDDMSWRWAFVGGLLVGGLLLFRIHPGFFENVSGRSLLTVAIGGVLVGFGTVMGGGCTSGHGVCGISRFSIRSITATLVFIALGVCTVTLFRVFVLNEAL